MPPLLDDATTTAAARSAFAVLHTVAEMPAFASTVGVAAVAVPCRTWKEPLAYSSSSSSSSSSSDVVELTAIQAPDAFGISQYVVSACVM
jgi:hypothetical protein